MSITKGVMTVVVIIVMLVAVMVMVVVVGLEEDRWSMAACHSSVYSCSCKRERSEKGEEKIKGETKTIKETTVVSLLDCDFAPPPHTKVIFLKSG